MSTTTSRILFSSSKLCLEFKNSPQRRVTVSKVASVIWPLFYHKGCLETGFRGLNKTSLRRWLDRLTSRHTGFILWPPIGRYVVSIQSMSTSINGVSTRVKGKICSNWTDWYFRGYHVKYTDNLVGVCRWIKYLRDPKHKGIYSNV